MTTIACDGLSIAGDGMVTDNGLICDIDFVKVRTSYDGRIVGCCGPSHGITEFMAWLNDPQSIFPALHESFESLVLVEPYLCKSYNCHGFAMDVSLPAAIGSGAKIAIGAMMAGAHAKKSVEFACTRDIYTGGNILCLTSTVDTVVAAELL